MSLSLSIGFHHHSKRGRGAGIVCAHTDQTVQTNCVGPVTRHLMACCNNLSSVYTLFDLESSQEESVGALLEVEDGRTCKLSSLE